MGKDKNPAIKDEYLKRTDVLEYVAHKALMLPLFNSFDVPGVCEKLLGQMQVENDPVLQFAEEFLPQFKWDLLSWKFLYAVYRAWMHDDVPSGRAVSKTVFEDRLKAYVDDNPSCGWTVTPAAVRTKNRIIGEEPLAVEYNLDQWFDIQPVNGSIRKVGTPHNMPISARGLLRVGTSSTDDE